MTAALEPDWTSDGPARSADSALSRDTDAVVRLFAAGTHPLLAIRSDAEFFFVDPSTTASGRPLPAEVHQFQPTLLAIRQRSRLTWEQLARVFGVARRSVHFWARGTRPSGDHAERISFVARLVGEIDTGDPEQTRAALLSPRAGGLSVFELLCEQRDQEAESVCRGEQIARLERDVSGLPSKRRRPPSLSAEERRRRQPFHPDDLLSADSGEPTPLGTSIGGGLVPGLRI